MLRCLGYCSTAVAPMPRAAFRELEDAARAKNQRYGVTGRLIHLWGRFIQIIEGPPQAVGLVFGAIAADPRHRSLVTLIDRPVSGRLFPGWSMDCHSAEDLTDGDRARFSDILRHTDRGVFQVETAGSHVRDLMAGIGAPWISELVRVPPNQTRALLALDRLMNAAQRRLLVDPLRTVTIEIVAKDAGMSRQAAYRYFASSDDLMRAVLSRAQASHCHAFQVLMADTPYVCQADLADAIVQFVVTSYRVALAVPVVARSNILELLSRHHQGPGTHLLAATAAVAGAVRRYDRAAEDPMLETKLAASLAGIASAIKGVALYDASLLESDAMHETLTSILLAALGKSTPPERS